MEPDELRISANGLTFGALAWGDPDAPLALLVHGYPDTAWTWRHLGPFLAARGWRAVAPFTRGYAPTDLAPDDRYRPQELARDLLALHGALGGDERAVLVGHDWGAVATYGVAAADPDRFAALVTLAVPPVAALARLWSRPSTVPLGLRQLRMSWYMAFNQLPGVSDRSLDRLVPRLWRTWSPGFDGRADSARFLAAVDSPARRRAALKYYRDTLRAVREADTVAARKPLLYLHGADDGCVQAEIAERFPDSLPAGSRAERVPGTGHFLQLEDPDRVNALIVDWIGSPE